MIDLYQLLNQISLSYNKGEDETAAAEACLAYLSGYCDDFGAEGKVADKLLNIVQELLEI